MKTVKIYLIGVGGQGSLLASRILSEAVMREGLEVVMSEVHGMSQRGGVVESTVIIGGLKSPLIRKGDADILVAFEPDECLRAAQYCSKKTRVVVNMRPVIPPMVSIGKASYIPPETVVERLKPLTGRIYPFDATALAEKAGTAKASNIVVLGALTGLKLIPVSVETMQEVVLEFVPQKYAQANIDAYQSGVQYSWNEN